MSVMIEVIDLSSLKSGERMDRPSYVDGWEERQNKHSRNAFKVNAERDLWHLHFYEAIGVAMSKQYV